MQRLARVPVAALVQRTGHNAHLAVLHGRDVVYLIEERARRGAPLVTDVGVRLPAHLTASGRAMLATLPSAQLRALFPDAGAFVQRNELGPASLPELRQLLDRDRRRGYAEENSEVTAGFASVGAAVHDREGRALAAVAVTFPAGAVSAGERPALAAQVTRTARELSRRLGSR